MKINLDQLKPNPEQPRSSIDKVELQSLADSIREHGLLNPISVEGPQEDGTYIILDGERRWRAHQLAGMTEIECYVARPALNGSANVERLLLGIIGNLQRQDMNLIERASGYKRLHDLGMTYQDIGQACGMTPSMIGTNIRLLDLPIEIQAHYAQAMSPFDVRIVARLLELPKEQAVRLANQAVACGMTTKRILWLANRLTAKNDPAEYRGEKRQDEPNDDSGDVQEKTARKNPVFMAKAEFGHWNALAQLRLQHAELQVEEKVKKAAIATCQNCALYEDASQNVCRDCPAVELIRRLW